MNKLVLITSLFISACAGLLESVDEPTAKQLQADVLVYTDSQLESIPHERIQPIKATSCKNEVWDPSPSEEDAVNQLRERTSSLGGNGIANLICEAAEGTNYRRKCWISITCYATAIKVGREASIKPN